MNTHVRHGLYLPVELLEKLRIVAAREKRSINRQIETIIREWLSGEAAAGELSRDDLLLLSPEVRDSLLCDRAEKMRHYYEHNDEFDGSEGDLYEY
ncbi:MAG TPA: Arc family DNA-binding protein [Candidatus Rifleibacterium sp.]|nr:Arc family DNA-binding protein [Candidatus Rifleibacterium sp.]HOI92787.1 Arc family DNA-binding protein [Candidatus Rifleibacterium sp.]